MQTLRIAGIIMLCFLFLPLSGQKKWERLTGRFDRHYQHSDFDASLDDALSIQEYSLTHFDSTDSRYALSSYYVAKAYEGLGDPESARPYIRIVYDWFLPKLAYDANMGEVCLLYGQIETQLGYHKSALLLLSRALEIHLELYGQESLAYVQALYAMADLEMAMAHWDEMVSRLTDALQIHERNAPLDHDYALYANYMGLLFMNSERIPEAVLYFNKSLLAYQAYGIKEDLTWANAQNNLGLISYYGSEFEDAALHFEQAALIYPKVTEGYSENYLMLLSNRASLYFTWGKKEELKASYLKLGEYLDRYGERKDLPYIQGLENMANFYANAGNFQESEAFYLRAIGARKVVDHIDQEGLQRTILSLVSVCEEFNETQKAAYYLKMAEEVSPF